MNNRFKIRTLLSGFFMLTVLFSACTHDNPPLVVGEYYVQYSLDEGDNCQSFKGGIGEIDFRDNIRVGGMSGKWEEDRCKNEFKVPGESSNKYECVDLAKFEYLLVVIVNEDSAEFWVSRRAPYTTTCN